MERQQERSVIVTAAVLTVATVTLVLLKMLAVVLEPLAVAFMLYFAATPLKNMLLRRGVPQPIARFALILTTVLAMALFGWVITTQVQNAADALPVFRERLNSLQSSLRSAFGYIPLIGARLSRAASGRDISSDSLGKFAA